MGVIWTADLDGDDPPGSIRQQGQVLVFQAFPSGSGLLLEQQLAARIKNDVEHLQTKVMIVLMHGPQPMLDIIRTILKQGSWNDLRQLGHLCIFKKVLFQELFLG